MIKIVDEDFTKYNANVKGADVGDCFARSLSLAYNIPYKQVRKELLDGRRYDYEDINSDSNTQRYIRNKGYIKKLHFKEDTLLVADFIQQNPTGCWIIYCQRGHNRVGHLSCIINGDVYDTWDCSDPTLKYCVTDAFLISAENSTGGLIKDFTGIPIAFVEEIKDHISKKFEEYEALCGFASNNIILKPYVKVTQIDTDTINVYVRLRFDARAYTDNYYKDPKFDTYFKLEIGKDIEKFKTDTLNAIDENIKKIVNSVRLTINKIFFKNGISTKLGWEKQQRAARTVYDRPKDKTLLGIPVDGRVIDVDLYKKLSAKYRPGCKVLKQYKDGIAFVIMGRDDEAVGIGTFETMMREIEYRVRRTITNAVIQQWQERNPGNWMLKYLNGQFTGEFDEEFIKNALFQYNLDVFGMYANVDRENNCVSVSANVRSMDDKFTQALSSVYQESADAIDFIVDKIPNATVRDFESKYENSITREVTFDGDQILDIIK